MDPDFPANSQKSQKTTPEPPKDVKAVVTGEVVRKKPGLIKQFKGTFFGGDGRTAVEYTIFSVLIPAAKEAMVDAASQGFERLIFGESRGRSPRGRGVNPVGHVQYNRFAGNDKPPLPDPRRSISRRGRSQFDFDEIVLQDRGEAEEVLDSLFNLVNQFGSASVSDLYALCGIKGTHTDVKWGWVDLRGASVTRMRGGYLLDLPEPEPFND